MANVQQRHEKEHVLIDELNIGLDRSAINSKGQIQLPDQSSRSDEPHVARQGTSGYAESESPSSSSHHLVNSIKQRKHHAAVKIRKSLHISKDSDFIESNSPVLARDADEQSDARLMNRPAEPEKPTLKDFIHNPVDVVKTKVSGQGSHQVAANIAAKEIPHGQDVDIVNASLAVDNARTDTERLLAIKDLSKLMTERQNTYARWTLDRHITKVRALPRDTVAKRPREAFETVNDQEGLVIDWRSYGQHLVEYYAQQYGGQYIGYGSNPPKPSKETVMPNVERLIVASSPFQEFAMSTRRVYRWEQPAETAKYLLVYLTLWFFNLLLPGMISAIMYLVIQRHIHGNTLDDLREDIKHREDVERTALSLTELVVKKGDKQWADDLLEGLGPWAMVQLADLANFFESVRNFYEWRKPYRTKGALAVMGVGVLITSFLPLWLLVKSITFGAGFTFFALFPLSANFPEYRLLVSPTKRLLWNIPTHAEWAIQYIQAEGSLIQDRTTSQPRIPPINATPGVKNANDYGYYTAHHEGKTGHLIISILSVRFVSNKSHDVYFVLPYEQIQRFEKQDRIIHKGVPDKLKRDSGKDLLLVSKTGQEWVLKDLDQRDEAFSQIVGFSKVDWQVVW